MRVCVEGNIGSGKSTALEALRALRPDVALRPEPVDDWQPLLSLFYADPRRWALAFNLRVLLSFDAAGGGVVERSPLSARHVFAQLLFNENKMTQAEWELYKEYWDTLAWKPDVLVYVHTPADQCHARVAARGREAERDIDIHYLRRLEFQYETMLRFCDVPVVRLDGTQPPEQLAAAIAAVADKCGGGGGGGGVSRAPAGA